MNTKVSPKKAAMAAYRKATRKQWLEFHTANDAMLRIAREQPRKPWHRKRHFQAMMEYERTLNAIPSPPCDENVSDQTPRTQDHE